MKKILSDSQAVIKALKNTHITATGVLETLEYIKTLAHRVKRLTLSWIKAHVKRIGGVIALG